MRQRSCWTPSAPTTPRPLPASRPRHVRLGGFHGILLRGPEISLGYEWFLATPEQAAKRAECLVKTLSGVLSRSRVTRVMRSKAWCFVWASASAPNRTKHLPASGCGHAFDRRTSMPHVFIGGKSAGTLGQRTLGAWAERKILRGRRPHGRRSRRRQPPSIGLSFCCRDGWRPRRPCAIERDG